MSDNEISYQEHWDEIESIANIIEDQYDPDSDELSEIVFNSVDSHQWIMYHGYPVQILQYTEPDDWTHFVNDSSDYRDVLSAMAFSAMRKDVWGEIRERDIE